MSEFNSNLASLRKDYCNLGISDERNKSKSICMPHTMQTNRIARLEQRLGTLLDILLNVRLRVYTFDVLFQFWIGVEC